MNHAVCRASVFLLAAAFLFATLHAQDDLAAANERSARWKVANVWLDSLCVLPSKTLDTVTSDELKVAFETWEKDPGAGTGCKPANVQVDRSFVDLRYWKRLARVPEFRAIRQQVPSSVIGVIQGEDPNTEARAFKNPQSGLYSFGGPVHFDEFYVGADVRASVCAMSKYFTNPDKKCSQIEYVAAGRGVDKVSRVVASITLDINFSQVPLFQNGLLITDPTSIGYPKWTKTVTGSFNPAKFFRSTAEWKAIVDNMSDLTAFRKNGEPFDPKMPKKTGLQELCGYEPGVEAVLNNKDTTANCLTHMTVGGRREKIILSTIPTVSVSATTPFELSKFGTSYRASNSAGESLYTVTASWNLRNIFAPSSVRAGALATLIKANPAKAQPLTVGDTEKLRIRQRVHRLYAELQCIPARAENDDWWDRFETAVLLVQ